MCNNATVDLRRSFSFRIVYAAAIMRTSNYVRDEASPNRVITWWKLFSVLWPAQIIGAITKCTRGCIITPWPIAIFRPGGARLLADLDHAHYYSCSVAKIITHCDHTRYYIYFINIKDLERYASDKQECILFNRQKTYENKNNVEHRMLVFDKWASF